jgi:hypothetical protein
LWGERIGVEAMLVVKRGGVMMVRVEERVVGVTKS